MVIIFHPNCITYDNSIARTWEQYRKRKKRNLNVKEFRKAVGMPENGNWMVGGGTVNFNGETYLGKWGKFDINSLPRLY